MLWQFGEGTNRGDWLPSLLGQLWEFDQNYEINRKDFLTFLRTARAIPPEVKAAYGIYPPKPLEVNINSQGPFESIQVPLRVKVGATV